VAACPTQALSLATPSEVMERALRSSAQRFLEALQSQKQLQTKS
jgi:hypothetical protein